MTLVHRLAMRIHRVSDDRGDVPGWVLITIMTAGIVAVIWGVAEDLLRDLLRDALASVSPRG